MAARTRVLTIVMAGGAGGRLEALTQRRAKPAVPYGGIYRLIDFPLSNCRNSGYADVWVIEQFNPATLSDHLANGRPWDLDRTQGGLVVLHPHLGGGREGWHRGTADALWRNAALIRDYAPDALLVLSADAVYRMDYRDPVEAHLASGADVTMVTVRVDPGDAGRYGVVQMDGGAVTDYAHKPDEPASDLVSNEILVFEPDRALDLLDELAEPDGELEDFGDRLLPRLVAKGLVCEHRMESYWRDVGTVDAYWRGHMDLLGVEPAFDLNQAGWPILTRQHQRPPARITGSAVLDDAYISPGSVVRGRVERSVLSPGVLVEQGATVSESVLLDGVVVRAGATVERAIVDAGAEVGGGDHGGGGGEITLLAAPDPQQ